MKNEELRQLEIELIDEMAGCFYSMCDRMIVDFSQELKDMYDAMFFFGKFSFMKKAEEKIAEKVVYQRFLIDCMSFVRSHCIDEFVQEMKKVKIREFQNKEENNV